MLKSTKAAREARQRQELYRIQREQRLAREAASSPAAPRVAVGEPGYVGRKLDPKGADEHFVHYCQCGAWGAFGYGATGGKLGTWYCAEHRPGS